MLTGALFLVGGLACILWGAARFTDGAMRTATRFAVSPFYVGAIVSGFEPENLVTGVAAALGDLPQVALGTVIGSAVFLLTAGLGLTLLLVPMPVEIPRAGPVGMLAALTLFAATIFTGGGSVGRAEGALLITVSAGLLVWLYRRSSVFQRRSDADDIAEAVSATSTSRALGLLLGGALALVVGAELLVSGARTVLSVANLSETFLGMVVVGMGESLCSTSTLMRAIASSPPTRETALLMAEAIPAWRTSTAFITVVVSGATVTAIPSPSTTIGGKKVLQ
jgi:cation:H+ antiporter